MENLDIKKFIFGMAAAILSFLAIFFGYDLVTKNPSPEPVPSVSASPIPTASISPVVSPTPIVSAVPTLSPTPIVSVSPTPSVSASPTPIVSVSPTPTVSASPIPTASISPTPMPTVVPSRLVALRGEVLGMIIRNPQSPELPIGAKAFEIKTVKTLIPSFKGARVGDWEDPLIPVTSIENTKSYWVDFEPLASGTFKILGQEISVELLNQDYIQPAPFYMELQFAQVSRAHNLADEGSTLKTRGDLNAKYRALYREHGVEPIKQAINFYPTDQNTWSEFGVSYKQTVIDGAIAPPCLLGPDPGRVPTIAEIQRMTSWAPSGWFYAWDEGEGTLDAQALSRAQLIKNAGGHVYITRQWSQAFAPFVDLFFPVINWFDQPGRVAASMYSGSFGLYASCMSNGNCANHQTAATVGMRSPFPSFVIETPSEPRDFVMQSLALGSKALLYFNGTQKLSTAWADGGQYNEGGNGDGTLVYPCPGTLDACPSLRMKYIRLGLQDYAKSLLK